MKVKNSNINSQNIVIEELTKQSDDHSILFEASINQTVQTITHAIKITTSQITQPSNISEDYYHKLIQMSYLSTTNIDSTIVFLNNVLWQISQKLATLVAPYQNNNIHINSLLELYKQHHQILNEIYNTKNRFVDTRTCIILPLGFWQAYDEVCGYLIENDLNALHEQKQQIESEIAQTLKSIEQTPIIGDLASLSIITILIEEFKIIKQYKELFHLIEPYMLPLNHYDITQALQEKLHTAIEDFRNYNIDQSRLLQVNTDIRNDPCATFLNYLTWLEELKQLYIDQIQHKFKINKK